MRLVAACIAATCFAEGAHTEDQRSVMAEIHAAGHWSGCVYQDGFDPYAIRVSPRPAPTLKVDYPGLCSGYHTPRQRSRVSDAVEVITQNKGTCIELVDVNYSFDGDVLRLDFLIEGSAYALLRPIAPDDETLSCIRDEVSS